jgi:formylglycine-generating enzyme required for sulfatase activity
MCRKILLGPLILLLSATLVSAQTQRVAVARPPGAIFTECSLCPLMVVIPAGAFVMAAKSSSDHEVYSDGSPGEFETPDPGRLGTTHTVKVDVPFAMGVSDVTRAQYAAWSCPYPTGQAAG